MTTEEAVQRGTTLMQDSERALQTAQKKLAALPAVFAAVRDEGHIGNLETLALSAEARALAGQVAAAELAVVSFHRTLTARSSELGIELPQPLSGGGR